MPVGPCADAGEAEAKGLRDWCTVSYPGGVTDYCTVCPMRRPRKAPPRAFSPVSTTHYLLHSPHRCTHLKGSSVQYRRQA